MTRCPAWTTAPCPACCGASSPPRGAATTTSMSMTESWPPTAGPPCSCGRSGSPRTRPRTAGLPSAADRSAHGERVQLIPDRSGGEDGRVHVHVEVLRRRCDLVEDGRIARDAVREEASRSRRQEE